MNTLTKLDELVVVLDNSLRTVFGRPPQHRATPGAELHAELSESERTASASLMRVNHAGEVCAQALYQGQAVFARDRMVKLELDKAAEEENDHLAWCEERLRNLNERVSVLNPFWYAGSFVLGALASATGDRWSLGFLAETERQVTRHLEGHLERLPPGDAKSRAIVAQMREDEAKHATTAVKAGAAELPEPVRLLMALAAKVMTTTAARV
jgi:ubiquinone biosynthesis monooxygenase Coq7